MKLFTTAIVTIMLCISTAALDNPSTTLFTSEVSNFSIAFPSAELTYRESQDSTHTVQYTAWAAGHVYGALVGIETESKIDAAQADVDFFAMATKNFAKAGGILSGCARETFSGYPAERCQVEYPQAIGTILFIRREPGLLYGVMGLQHKGNGEDAQIAALLASFKFLK